MHSATYFRRKFPSIDERIDALTFGISPDPRLALMLSLQPRREYGQKAALEAIGELLGLPVEDMPIKKDTFWAYCATPRRGDISLNSLGLVRRARSKPPRKIALTSFGEEFGQFVAAMALRAMQGLEVPTKSMAALYGLPAQKPVKGIHRRRFVNNLVSLLAQNPAKRYRITDAVTEIGGDVVNYSETVRKLGLFGIVDYARKEGEKGHSKFVLNPSSPLLCASPDFVYSLAQEAYGNFFYRTALETILEHISENPTGVFRREELMATLDLRQHAVSRTFAALERLDILNSGYGLQANGNTRRWYSDFIEPLEKLAETGDPEETGLFDEVVRFRETDLQELGAEILGAYLRERNGNGSDPEEILAEIDALPRSETFTFSRLRDRLSRPRLIALSNNGAWHYIKEGIKAGSLEEGDAGYTRV